MESTVGDLHVTIAAHDLYPDPGSGGTGRYVYETSRRLVEAGHRVSVVTRRRGDVPTRETIEGIDVYRYDITIADETAPAILRQLPAATRRVRDHVDALSEAEPPDIVSFQGPVTSMFVDRAVGAAPRVTTFHSPWPIEYGIKTRDDDRVSTIRRRLNIVTRWLCERCVLARSDRLIVLSDFMRRKLREVYGDSREATVVHGGVDVDRFTPDARSYEALEGDGPAFLTVRRLSERMGHDRLLAAFATVREAHSDARLYVAGDGPLRDRLERLAARLGVADATTFLGYVPDEDLPAAYASADVFVLPTQELEGFGLATLEALASGTPVVATPVGGTVEVLEGLDGELPAPPLTDGSAAEDLATGMTAWAGIGSGLRDTAGRICRRYVSDNYTWQQTVDKLLDEYDQIIE